MRRRGVNSSLAILPWLAAGATPLRAAPLSEFDAARGVRAALERGAGIAVDLLGRPDGFLGNPKVRIELPSVLNDAARWFAMVGQRKRVDDLVVAMNRAAEAAVPKARSLLVAAVKSMSVDDARGIVAGGDDSVTRFFAGKTRTPLESEFLPIVTQATQRVSLAAKYNKVASKAASLGMLDARDSNIEQYVTGKALDGLYLMIGEEERKIRQDPLGTGSALLKKVFGSFKAPNS